MKSLLIQTAKFRLIVAAAALFALTGCMSSSTEGDYQVDGSSGFINQEAINMGQTVAVESSAKTAKDSDTVTGEIMIHRLHYNDTCKCFVREAEFTFTNGSGKTFARVRDDSIWLVDSSGNYLASFHPLQAASVIHHRHVVKINGSMDIDLQFNTTLTWTTDANGNKTGVIWSGTFTGTFNGTSFNGSIVSVKRPFSLYLGFGFPTEGMIHALRGSFTIDITFKGSGKAEIVITGKGKIHHVDCDGGDETQKD